MDILQSLPARLALLPLVAALLGAGCGPNSGGTGTGDGPITLASFDAKPTSACSSTIATSLSCGATSLLPVGVTQLAGTDIVYFTGSAASGSYVLTVKGNTAVLESRCNGARFEGDWGVVANGEERFYGSWVGAARGDAVAAQLWPQPVALLRDVLQVLVADRQGSALFGPVLLRRQAAPPTEPAACP